MKAGIVGIGAVGTATAMALTLRARVRELVLVNRNPARAKGVATDMRYGTPLSQLVQISDGDYADLAGAGVVIVAAGVNEKTGGATDRNDPLGRLRLLEPIRGGVRGHRAARRAGCAAGGAADRHRSARAAR